MFDDIRETLRSLSGRLDADERRRQTAGMRDALVHAKLAVQELREALATTEGRLAAERTELATVRRRQGYAAEIGDTDTVAIAERFAQQHEERVAVLESKRMVAQQELVLAEREYDTMSDELRRIMSGLSAAAPPSAGSPPLADAAMDSAGPAADTDEAAPRRTRADREADAEARLAELKRRFGR